MPMPSTRNLVALENVRFGWAGARGAPVLDIEHLTLARGERVFLRGPSGSGKTTLLGLMAAVLQPDSGRITVDDVDLNTLSGAARDRFRADRIGFVFQQFNLLPFLSVAGNVQLPCRFSSERRLRACADGGSLESETQRLLDALQLPHRQFEARRTMQLSVGQQQRVAVARALIGRPALIIADEPTSALDADARSAFIALLFAEVQAAGSTLLFVSHDASLASDFDRVLDLPLLNRVPGEH